GPSGRGKDVATLSLTNSRRWGVAAATAFGILALTGPVVAPSAAGATPQPVPKVQIVVKMASSGVRASSVLTPITGQALGAPAQRYVVTVSAGAVPAALAKLNSDPRVAFADRVRTLSAVTVPNDPCFAGTACVVKTTEGGSITSPS